MAGCFAEELKVWISYMGEIVKHKFQGERSRRFLIYTLHMRLCRVHVYQKVSLEFAPRHG